MIKQHYKKAGFLLADVLIINSSLYFALMLRFEGVIPPIYFDLFLHSAIAITVAKLAIYYYLGLYNSLWKHAGMNELVKIIAATTFGSGIAILYGFAFDRLQPKSIYIMTWFITATLICASRFSIRMGLSLVKLISQRHTEKSRVLIIGAGDAGALMIKELRSRSSENSVPIAAIDDDVRNHRAQVNGVPVVGGRDQIKAVVKDRKIDEIIIAIPSAPKTEIAAILKICKETDCILKTLPDVYDMISGTNPVEGLRDVNIQDLLGRNEIRFDASNISQYLKDEVVMVTGGGGSIGSELCRQIAAFKPKKLIVFDIYENNAYDLQNELLYAFGETLDLEVLIGSVRDQKRLDEVFRLYHPTVVFHAAAHKHVPLMEGSPEEAIKNNVFGTNNVATCAHQYGVKRFILISTDKAVNPTNIMGATKRMAEMIIQTMDKRSKTEFAAVRFGNVLGSNGSVIPLFTRQMEQGGPVTVTHPDITRFFMTIPEAVRLVIQAEAMAKGGEIFVLDMGEPVKILDLAKDLIKLTGYEIDVDMSIEFTGLRPGEKLYEELLMSEEGLTDTPHKHIFVGKSLDLSYKEVQMRLKMLENCLKNNEDIRACMAKAVDTYDYKENVQAVI